MEQESIIKKISKISVLNQVTPLSKYLAMLLFIILPFIGGLVGFQYATVSLEDTNGQVLETVSRAIPARASSHGEDFAKIWEKNRAALGNVKSLESLAYIPQEYGTLLDGDEETSDILREYFHFNSWKDSRVERLGITIKLPPAVWSYSNLADDGCERSLVIEDESQGTSSVSRFFITPSTQSCDINSEVVAHDGTYSLSTYETSKVIILNAEAIDEIKGFLKGYVLSDLIGFDDSCNFDGLELYPSYTFDGFQYLFPLIREDDQSTAFERRCDWRYNRPHIKFDRVRHVAIIMIDGDEWWHPDFISKFPGGSQVAPSFNREIFESISFSK